METKVLYNEDYRSNTIRVLYHPFIFLHIIGNSGVGKMKKIFILLFVGFFLVNPVSAGLYEDINDDCSNLTKIQAIHNLIVNGSHIGFNMSIVGAIPENLTSASWTELDTPNRLTVTSNNITATDSQPTDTSRRVYQDMGANNIGDFTVLFEYNQTKITNVASPITKDCMIGAFAEYDNVRDISSGVYGLVRGTGSTLTYQIRINSEWLGVSVSADSITLNVSQKYYIKFTKLGTFLGMEIFNDDNYANLVDEFNLTSTGNRTHRYWTFFNGLGFASGGGQQQSGVIGNIRFGSTVGLTDGVIYTVDLMSGITTDATALLTHIDVATFNSITVEISSNNSTWQQLNGTLENGYDGRNLEQYNYSTAYLRYNFSRPLAGGICNLENYKLLYPTTCIGGGGGSTLTTWNMSSIHIIAGNYNSGTINDTKVKDASYYRVDETVGSPCLDVRFNFTNINATVLSLSGRLYSQYEGNPAHVIDYEAFNFTSNSWVVLALKSEHDFEWSNHSLSLNTEDFLEDGKFWGRVNHVSSGASGHYLNIDYMRLHGYVQSGVSGVSNYWWLAMFFIAVPMIIILVKVLK